MTPSRGNDAFHLGRWMGLACAAMLWTAPWLWAQSAPPPRPAMAVETTAAPTSLSSAAGAMPTLTELFMTSPIINTIITCLSVVAVVMFVYFLLTISSATFSPPSFIDDVTKLAVSKQYEQAANLCRNNRSIFAASILQRCFENANRDPTHLLSIIEAEGQRRSGLIWNRISYLIDLSVVAPMLGLLGTVLGMLYAFFGLNKDSASASSKVLAHAIGGAMTATFFGLIVAIMAVVFHSIIKSRTLRALSEVEQTILSIADYMKRGQS